MNYDDLLSAFNLEENCIEVENRLQDLFSESFSDPFEIGMFPEQDVEDDSKFFISLDVESKKTKLSKDQATTIALEVEQTLLGLIAGSFSKTELARFKDAFSGAQVFLNGKQLR